MGKLKVVVLGSINYDCVAKAKRLPKKGETVKGTSFQTFIGGKGANQAVQLTLLGADVTFIGKIGNDQVGSHLKQSLQAKGVNVEYLKVDGSTNSGAANINIDQNGNNTLVYVPGANQRIRKQDIDAAVNKIKTADIFITQNEVNLNMIEYGLKVAKKYGVITILNPAPAVNLPQEILEYVDYITPNETETEEYTGILLEDSSEALKSAANWFINRGVKHVVITLGEKGSYYYDTDDKLCLPAFKINAIDSTAAGDAFNGGFAYVIGSGGSIEEAMSMGSACGALAASCPGAQWSLPAYNKVVEFMAKNKK